VWAFRAVSLSNDKTRHELLTTVEDFVDTFGRSYFIPLEGSEDMEISSIVAGGGVVVASEAESRTSTTGSRFCHWERHKLSYGVERTGRIPFKKTDLLAIGSLETNNQCPLDEGQTFDHSICFLRELAVEPAYWTFTGIQVGLTAGQYLGGQAVGIWKRGPAINLKDRIIDKWFGDGYWKLNALNSPWGL